MEQSKRKNQNNLKETERLGNTGWFDENFNQLKTILRSIPCNISILMGIKSIQSIIQSKTKVKMIISAFRILIHKRNVFWFRLDPFE
jgi:hypothetical protein